MKSCNKDGNNATLIDYRLYDPSAAVLFKNRNNKAIFRELFCTLPSCRARKKGKCAVWNVAAWGCPYGLIKSDIGFTKRAAKFRSWINERKKRVDGICQLKALKKIEQIGEYIYFPYPHWHLDKTITDKLENKSKGRISFFTIKEFTVELFELIVNTRPRSLFGGEITSYQKDVVPQIVLHTEEQLPEFYRKWSEMYPETAGKYKVKNYVGRKAFLKTCVVGAEFKIKRGDVGVWDGKFLIIDNYNPLFPPVRDCLSTKMIFEPTDKTTIVITNNSQVDRKTLFDD